MRVLAIVAHPDDELLGLGATLARHVLEGDDVRVVICAQGLRARLPGADKSEVEFLKDQARAAANILGIQPPLFFDFPDNQMDRVPLLDIVQRVEEVVSDYLPSVVYTHHQGDLNVDHQLVGRAVLTATRPLEGGTVREVYAFETQSSTEWVFGAGAEQFRPNRFVNVSSTFSKKLSALACYASEVRPFPHPRSAEALTALAQWRGAAAGFLMAEAFVIVRSLVGAGAPNEMP